MKRTRPVTLVFAMTAVLATTGLLAPAIAAVATPSIPAASQPNTDASDAKDAWWDELLWTSGYTRESLLAETGYTPETLEKAIKNHKEETGGGFAFIPAKYAKESLDGAAESLVDGISGGLITRAGAIETLDGYGAKDSAALLAKAAAKGGADGIPDGVAFPIREYAVPTLNTTHLAQTQPWSCGITAISHAGETITAGSRLLPCYHRTTIDSSTNGLTQYLENAYGIAV